MIKVSRGKLTQLDGDKRRRWRELASVTFLASGQEAASTELVYNEQAYSGVGHRGGAQVCGTEPMLAGFMVDVASAATVNYS